MNLFLSSMGVPSHLKGDLLSLFKKPANDIRLAYISTAAEVYPEDSREWERDALASLHATGIQTTPLDLKSFTNPEDLRKALAQFDGVWVSGGHTYTLRYWMRQSGFDQIIIPLLESGFVYTGYSAAAMVMGNTLELFDQFDPEDSEPLEPERIYTALNLLPFAILPHWNDGSPERESYTQKTFDGFKTANHPLQTITDEQAIVIRDGGWKLVQ